MAFTKEPYGEFVGTAVRVMTWNVKGRFGPWERRLPAPLDVLRATDPDVVLLQEAGIDDASAEQTAVLREAVGLHHVSGTGALLFGSWGSGSGVPAAGRSSSTSPSAARTR